MAGWVIGRQSLLKSEMGIGQRRNHNVIAFDRNPDLLIGAQTCCMGDNCG